jgi:hypothetical protein
MRSCVVCGASLEGRRVDARHCGVAKERWAEALSKNRNPGGGR